MIQRKPEVPLEGPEGGEHSRGSAALEALSGLEDPTFLVWGEGKRAAFGEAGVEAVEHG